MTVTKVPNQTRYLVVSGDSHAGPSLAGQLRQYCPPEHLEAFDVYASEVAAHGDGSISGFTTFAHAPENLARVKACQGLQDPHARLADMDAQGVAVDVVFAGGQNDEPLPFVGSGIGAGPRRWDADLRALGSHIWNQWLSDFVSVAPERFVGAMQVPIWDVDKALDEVRWSHAHGLRAINLPAPRSDFAPYNDPVYEPLWSFCAEAGLPLLTHSGGGDRPLGVDGPGANPLLHQAETQWFSRRALWQLILSGVFERHPNLKMVFTEQRVEWVVHTLKELESIHYSHLRWQRPSQPPSHYWEQNCAVAASFMAPFEVALRDKVGLHQLMWGSDYPHVEGTWPDTQLSIRHTFADVPEDDMRLILGENAVEVYGLDRAALRKVADRIGPTPDDLARPVDPADLPDTGSYAYRTRGSYS